MPGGNEVTQRLVSQAEHARLCGVSKKSVTAWKHAGKLHMVDGLVDFERSYRGEQRRTSASLLAQLQALDWSSAPAWSEAGQHQRVQAAARALGLEAVRSDRRDDGHWGGWQIRIAGAAGDGPGLTAAAVVGGFGFELNDHAALQHLRSIFVRKCRGPWHGPERSELDPAALMLLAYPLSPGHQRET